MKVSDSNQKCNVSCLIIESMNTDVSPEYDTNTGIQADVLTATRGPCYQGKYNNGGACCTVAGTQHPNGMWSWRVRYIVRDRKLEGSAGR